MSEQRISRAAQTSIYFRKCFRAFFHDKRWKALISTALIVILICMVTGRDTFVTYKATKSSSFALICACIWIGIFNSIRLICRERDIIKREHRTGLHMSSYVAALGLSEALLCCVEGILAAVIVRIANHGHFIQSGVLFWPTAELCMTFFVTIYSSDMLGLLISSIVRTENAAMTVMPFALIIQLIMSGMIFDLEGLSKMISNLTISRWGQAAVLSSANVNQMGFSRLAEYESTPGHLLFLWLLLLMFAAAYGCLAVISLQFIDNSSR